MKLKDKVVLITASTRGIGLACVKECAREGAMVYMAARNLALAKSEADKLISQGYNVKCVYNDASKPESFITMIEEVITDSGQVRIWIFQTLIQMFFLILLILIFEVSLPAAKKQLSIWQSKVAEAL